MSDCARPLDPVDVEALASGSEPLVAPDAAAHASTCAICGEAVRRAERLERLLGEAGPAAPGEAVPADLADRVLRVRPFSYAEKWSLSVWYAPLLLLAALFATGTALVAGPLAGARDQVGLAAAFLASLTGLLRASLRLLLDLSRSAPAGLEALSELLAPTSLGWAAVLLLLPTGFALRAVFAKAFSRR